MGVRNILGRLAVVAKADSISSMLAALRLEEPSHG